MYFEDDRPVGQKQIKFNPKILFTTLFTPNPSKGLRPCVITLAAASIVTKIYREFNEGKTADVPPPLFNCVIDNDGTGRGEKSRRKYKRESVQAVACANRSMEAQRGSGSVGADNQILPGS